MAFNMSLWSSFAINATLTIIFFVVSLFFEQKYQLIVAKVLSVLYGIVMLIIMVVLVIEAVRLRDQCVFTPSTTTLIIVASAYIFAGLLHPTQWRALPWGVVYYLTIPSMYFFLTFYCLFNLTDKSWGTRESPSTMEATSCRDTWTAPQRRKRNGGKERTDLNRSFFWSRMDKQHSQSASKPTRKGPVVCRDRNQQQKRQPKSKSRRTSLERSL